MKKTSRDTSAEKQKIKRRSTRLQAKRIAEHLQVEETEQDDRPEEVTFQQGGELAREERQRVTGAVVRTSEKLREKRRRFAERNRIQKEAKRAKAMRRLPSDVLEAIAKKEKEKSEDTSLQQQHSSSEDNDSIDVTDTKSSQLDCGPFHVLTVQQAVSKPRGVNAVALNFRQEHLYGDRLKRVNGLTFMSQKLKSHGPAVNFRQRNSGFV